MTPETDFACFWHQVASFSATLQDSVQPARAIKYPHPRLFALRRICVLLPIYVRSEESTLDLGQGLLRMAHRSGRMDRMAGCGL